MEGKTRLLQFKCFLKGLYQLKQISKFAMGEQKIVNDN